MSQDQGLQSERIVLAAPLSFSGSARRIWRLTGRQDDGAGRIALTVVAGVLVACAWTVVAVWYAVAFVLFGLLTVPYRLVRRGQRRDRLRREQHRELLAAVREGRR